MPSYAPLETLQLLFETFLSICSSFYDIKPITFEIFYPVYPKHNDNSEIMRFLWRKFSFDFDDYPTNHSEKWNH